MSKKLEWLKTKMERLRLNKEGEELIERVRMKIEVLRKI